MSAELTRVMICLVISIAVILFTILKCKLNPTIALIFGCLVMGLGSGMGLVETASTIGSGFGSLMTGIGLPIGLGVILGTLLEKSGGARVIADTLVHAAGEKYALYALGLASFLLAIPVFFDITFIILIPLAIEVSKSMKKPLPYTVGAITIGAAGAHTLVPPTPNPLAAASIFNFDLGIMLGVGALEAGDRRDRPAGHQCRRGDSGGRPLLRHGPDPPAAAGGLHPAEHHLRGDGHQIGGHRLPEQ